MQASSWFSQQKAVKAVSQMDHILAQVSGLDHACRIELRESSDDSCLRIQMKNAEEGIFPGLWFDHENAAHKGARALKTDSNAIGPDRSANDLKTAEVLDLCDILPIQCQGDQVEGVIGACSDRELLLPTSAIAIFQAQKSDNQ